MFNGQPAEIGAGFVNATPKNIKQAMAALRAITPNGSTNLYAGLEKGLEGLDSDRSSGIVLVTDGVANVGVTEKRTFLKLVKKQDVRLYTMVMGNSANRPLLKAISKESGGTAVNVSNSDDVIGAVLSATSKLSHEAMHDVKVTITGLRTADIAPESIGSLYRGQQLVLFGHYWGKGEAGVRLSAKVSGKPVTYYSRFTFPDVATLNPEVERLWSYAAIEDLMQQMDIFGEDADTKQAITDLAVEGGLVTPYTSMVVVREEVYAARGIDRDNARRLEKEQQAQAQRKSQPARSRRVDQTAAAFNGPQPSYGNNGNGGSSGGGALGPFDAILMLSFVAMVFLLRRRQGRTPA